MNLTASFLYIKHYFLLAQGANFLFIKPLFDATAMEIMLAG